MLVPFFSLHLSDEGLKKDPGFYFLILASFRDWVPGGDFSDGI